MLLPEVLVGLHKFVSKGQRVIMETDGKEVVELNFIRFMNDPNGIMRAKFKSINFINGRRTETPVDIFVRELSFRDLQLQISGAERESRTDFSITIGYQPWQREWRAVGIVKSRPINISNKDLCSLLQMLIKELY